MAPQKAVPCMFSTKDGYDGTHLGLWKCQAYDTTSA